VPARGRAKTDENAPWRDAAIGSTIPKMTPPTNRNVLGGDLLPCSLSPLTGYYRTGSCQVGADDLGCHAVCCVVTEEFLAFSRAAGNDLSTPMPHYGFPGLKPGDRWCVCAGRWKEALDAGYACPVILEATSEAALQYVTRSILEEYAVEPDA
jgi:uncharacterized protein (DUF2237 family)